MRGTFANVRIKNLMLPPRPTARRVEGGSRCSSPGEKMAIYDAAMKPTSPRRAHDRPRPARNTAPAPRATGRPRAPSCSASRPWWRELRAHPPLQPGRHGRAAAAVQGQRQRSSRWASKATRSSTSRARKARPQQDVTLRSTRDGSRSEEVPVLCRIDTPIEVDYYRHGGILPYVLRGESLRFGEVRDFPLADLLDLPGAADDEADLEGMAVADGYLWVVGSHGLKRKNAKPDRGHADNAKRLAKVTLDANRRLLACLPIEPDAKGEPCLVRQAQDGRRALRLKGDAQANLLTRIGWPMIPTSAPTWRSRARTTASTSKAWRWTDAGCCSACAARCCAAGRRCSKSRSRRVGSTAPGTPGRERHAAAQALPAARRPGRARPALLRRRPLHSGRSDDGAQRRYPCLQVARSPGPSIAANRDPVRFEAALTESVSLPHGHGTNRAEAICDLPPAIAGRQASLARPVRRTRRRSPDGEHTVFGDLLRHD
jgi:hypothetical protein